MYDVAIIGSGPAGLTAGVYSSRGNFKTIILEGVLPGGQLMTTTAVENWPGDISVQGPDLMERMRNHAKEYGSELKQDPVKSVDFSKKPFSLTCDSGNVVQARSVVIATGAHHRMLNIPGEKEYFAQGVSTCATCDAPFFRDKEVVVVGGGNTGVTEADHLLKFAKKLTLIQNLSELSANDPIKNGVLNHEKANFMYNSTVKEIKGDGKQVTEIIIENVNDGSTTVVPTSAVFVSIGFDPATKLFKGHLDMDQYGYLKLTGNTQTSVDGVFAAGDVSDFRYRQAITAAGMGCMAALDAQAYLATQGSHE